MSERDTQKPPLSPEDDAILTGVGRPSFASVKEYGKLFTDAEYWRPYVAAVCARHHLTPCHKVRSGAPGTNPVFIVDDRYVVKLYTHLFKGDTSFPVELDVYQLVARTPGFPAPALIASGTLFPDSSEWSWPYIVTQVIPGTSLSEVADQVSYSDKTALSSFLAPIVRRLHHLELEHVQHIRCSWNAFDHFLTEQRARCVENHRGWASLSERLIGQIEGFLPAQSELIDRTVPPHLLHCDLNADHVLGSFGGGRWRPAGIIDFGDAKVGDRLYELVALHIGLFRCDKRLLRVFLESYGFDEGLQRDFVLRAMSLTLLHEFNVLAAVFDASPAAGDVDTLAELAGIVWDIDRPELQQATSV